MAVLWIPVIVLVIMSIVLLTGRGAFLIAGYNTSSPEEKAKYDEKKLCRVTGAGMLLIAVLTGILALLGEQAPGWFYTAFVLLILADIAGMIYLLNTKCLAEGSRSETPKEGTAGRRAGKGSMIFTAVVFLIVRILLFTGNIRMQYDESSFTIRASYWSDKVIAYDDIEDIEYRTENVGGSRVGGVGSPRLQLGNFRNDEFGNYTRYTYTNCRECIVLTVKGKTVVLSGRDEEDTRAVYEELRERCGNRF